MDAVAITKADFNGTRAKHFRGGDPRPHSPSHDVTAAFGRAPHAFFRGHTAKGRTLLWMLGATKGQSHLEAIRTLNTLQVSGLRVRVIGCNKGSLPWQQSQGGSK